MKLIYCHISLFQFFIFFDNHVIEYLLKFGTEDNLLIGTDYTHADQSAEIQALDVIEHKGASEEISPEVARKVLDDNPRRFYGF